LFFPPHLVEYILLNRCGQEKQKGLKYHFTNLISGSIGLLICSLINGATEIGFNLSKWSPFCQFGLFSNWKL